MVFLPKPTALAVLSIALFAQSVSAAEIFVRWNADSTSTQLLTQVVPEARVIWRSSLTPGLQLVDIPLPDSKAVDAILARLEKLPQVRYAELNHRTRRKLPAFPKFEPRSLEMQDLTPNDPHFSRQWALVSTTAGINIQGAWEITRGSRDVRVAVIDTGVDPKHPELADRLAPGFDFIDETENVIDHHGHGSHVAGVIGAATQNGQGIAGVNHEVTIVPIRAVPSDGDETDADVIQAFEFAVRAGARIANCSFGKRISGQAVKDTLIAAGEAGLLVIASAGNDSADNNTYPAYPANFRTPNLVVVASTNSSGGMSYFSNYGMGMVDLGAPGSGILSSITGGEYASWSGTSMASPHVSGVAALALAANPALTVAQLRDILLASVAPVAALQGKVTTGGRIDATAAVKSALAVQP